MVRQRARVQGDEGDPVGDDVVHLAGDPFALEEPGLVELRLPGVLSGCLRRCPLLVGVGGAAAEQPDE